MTEMALIYDFFKRTSAFYEELKNNEMFLSSLRFFLSEPSFVNIPPLTRGVEGVGLLSSLYLEVRVSE